MTRPTTKEQIRFGADVISHGLSVLAARLRPLPPAATGADRTPCANAMFSASGVSTLNRERAILQRFDLPLHTVMSSPRLGGQIVFEYGTLLRAMDRWSGVRVLDIGTGRSTLPNWMSRQGAVVTTQELAKPAEGGGSRFADRVNDWVKHEAGAVGAVVGSMRHQPFADATFDLLTSLSVVEHLDTDLPSRAFVPYAEQQRRLAEVLDEMIRVTKPGGHLYITSECCDFGRATADNWKPAYYHVGGPELSGAWPVEDVPRLFYDYLADRGCALVGGVQFAPADIGQPDRWTWRGQYFSGFSVLAQRQ
jgi:SAM-dependent methyltransferase